MASAIPCHKGAPPLCGALPALVASMSGPFPRVRGAACHWSAYGCMQLDSWLLSIYACSLATLEPPLTSHGFDLSRQLHLHRCEQIATRGKQTRGCLMPHEENKQGQSKNGLGSEEEGIERWCRPLVLAIPGMIRVVFFQRSSKWSRG
jgi:hypothetical protein